jgi:predicted TIM-barrel fold metal-dependent hydrolase
MNRRRFLKASATSLGLGALSVETRAAADSQRSRGQFIDVNVNLSRWPVRRIRGDETSSLVDRLRRQAVTQAWAGSFDGLFHKDLGSVNERLADDCRRHGRGLLVPFGSINPKFPDWEEELRRCADVHRMPGIRLHPNYHGYQLDNPDFRRLLQMASARGMLVQLAVMMEDERMMHPLIRVEPVDTAPLVDLVRQTSGLQLVLLNALRTLRAQPLVSLVTSGEVYVEISMLEGVGGIANLFAQLPSHRVLFGSHAPLFYFESALLKLKESPLTDEQQRAIRIGNAQRLLAKNH